MLLAIRLKEIDIVIVRVSDFAFLFVYHITIKLLFQIYIFLCSRFCKKYLIEIHQKNCSNKVNYLFLWHYEILFFLKILKFKQTKKQNQKLLQLQYLFQRYIFEIVI
jgi:hypothetical protein